MKGDLFQSMYSTEKHKDELRTPTFITHTSYFNSFLSNNSNTSAIHIWKSKSELCSRKSKESLHTMVINRWRSWLSKLWGFFSRQQVRNCTNRVTLWMGNFMPSSSKTFVASSVMLGSCFMLQRLSEMFKLLQLAPMDTSISITLSISGTHNIPLVPLRWLAVSCMYRKGKCLLD